MGLSTNVKGAVVACLAVTIVMAVLPPTLFGSHEGELWAFVNKYQTLITGMLAVAAAGLTIRQSQGTDAKNERRHQQLMQFQLHPYRVKLERALNPQYADLNEVYERICELNLNREAFRLATEHSDYHYVDALTEHVLPMATHVLEITDREHFRAGTELFGGLLMDRLSTLIWSTSDLVAKLERHRSMSHPEHEDWGWYENVGFDEARDEIIDRMHGLTGALPAVLKHFEQLAHGYEFSVARYHRGTLG